MLEVQWTASSARLVCPVWHDYKAPVGHSVSNDLETVKRKPPTKELK